LRIWTPDDMVYGDMNMRRPDSASDNLGELAL